MSIENRNNQITELTGNPPFRKRSKSEEIYPKRYNYDSNLEKEIHEWLLEMPVFQNESNQEKRRREDMIALLVEKLQELSDSSPSQNRDRKMRSEIEKTINLLPIWSPGERTEQNAFIKHTTDSLLNRVKNLNTNKLKAFNNTSFIIERSECQRHCCGSNDMFENEVMNWVNEIPIRGIDNNGQPVNKNDIAKTLATKLRPIALKRPGCKAKYKEILIENIIRLISDLPIHICGCKKEEKLLLLAQKLADRLVNVVLPEAQKPAYCCVEKKPLNDDLQQSIVAKVTDILEQSHISANVSERDRTARDISEFLYRSIEAVRAGNDDTVDEISHIIQEDAHVPSNRADNIAISIADRVREMSLLKESSSPGRFSIYFMIIIIKINLRHLSDGQK